MKAGMKGITIQVPEFYSLGGADAKKVIDAFFQYCNDHQDKSFYELMQTYPEMDRVIEALNWYPDEV